MLEVVEIDREIARAFIDAFHPLKTRGALRGMILALGGYEDGDLSFVALFTHPRSRWKRIPVALELSRLAISPHARRSAATFLRKVARILRKRGFRGFVVTYAMPGTSGSVYMRAGWIPFGRSSGARRSRRGPNGRPTPDTAGSGVRLARFILQIESGSSPAPPRRPNLQANGHRPAG
jgi:GNAT superfamily N-acetyltransferase